MKNYKLVIECPKCKNVWFDGSKICDVCTNKKLIKKTKKEYVDELYKLIEVYD